MSGKLNKNAGFSLMPFAFLFLFEPSYAIIDPLPDFIGYIILCAALANLGDISTRISEAINGFWKAAILSAVRMGTIFLISNLFAAAEKSVGSLIFVFIFAILELIIVVPAYKHMFEGFIWLGMMYNGEVINHKSRRSKLTDTEKAYWLTVTFVCIKIIVCALPEFTSLISNGTYEFILLLRVFAIILTAPLALSWLITMIRYCSRVKRDNHFIDRISTTYLQKANSAPQIYIVRTLSIGVGVIMTAITLSIDIYADNVNALPDALFFVILPISAILMRKYSARWKSLTAVSVIGIAVSVISHYMNRDFFEKYSISAIRRDQEAYYAYYRVLGVTVFQSALMIAAVVIIGLMLRNIYLSHGDVENDTSKSQFKLNALLDIFIIMGSLAALASVYRLWAQPFFYRGWVFYYSTVIAAAINVAFILYSWGFTGKISESIKHKYRLYL